MKGLLFALGFGLISSVLTPGIAEAQKIIHVKSSLAGLAVTKVRVRKFGRIMRPRRHVTRKARARSLKRLRFSAFALPDQRLFPPYYEAQRRWTRRPDMASRIEGGKSVEQGSRLRSHIAGGRTVQGGSTYRSHMKDGRTVQGGSRWASHIRGGRTVEQGSQWRSTMPNWRFSGYAAPMRPKGIPYYRPARPARSPWASRP